MNKLIRFIIKYISYWMFWHVHACTHIHVWACASVIRYSVLLLHAERRDSRWWSRKAGVL